MASGRSSESTDSWTYASTTFRYANNNSNNGAYLVRGLNEDDVFVHNVCSAYNTGSAPHAAIGLDSATAAANLITFNGNGAVAGMACHYRGLPGLGYHSLHAIERSQSASNSTWYGDAGGLVQTGLFVGGMF